MNATWNKGPSPKDGRRYAITLENFQGDTWEGEAVADPKAHGGWSNGKWQDWAGEVKGWRPLPAAAALLAVK